MGTQRRASDLRDWWLGLLGNVAGLLSDAHTLLVVVVLLAAALVTYLVKSWGRAGRRRAASARSGPGCGIGDPRVGDGSSVLDIAGDAQIRAIQANRTSE